jgi:CheY-like chemotaxis protein/HPt (histidine-containing phosphotransfer) domain-containing protein
MLTSGDRPGDVQRCQDLGVSAYLRKPIKQSELFDSLVAALSVDSAEDLQSDSDSSDPADTLVLPVLKILLAEDSVVNQKLALGLLNRWGHSVTVANNGQEAIDLSARTAFDVILMDVQMPEVDGHEATRQIRRREAGTDQHTPIIAMTAHAMKGDRELCLESGMDEYVSKPVRPWQLMQTLGRFFAEGAATIGSAQEGSGTDDRTGGESSLATADPYQVDWPAAIKVVHGDRQLLREVSSALVEEARIVMSDLKYALKHEDAPTAQRMAHTIKASFRTFGVSDAHDLAFECEQAGKAGDLDLIRNRLSDLEEACREVSGQLREFIDTGQFPG